MPSFGSLFAGIGGLDLGLERAGWACRWQVEIDPFCQRVLAKHWPDVPRHGDVRTWPTAATEHVDLICGGFPCQPVSVAGKRLAQADARWLWPEFARVIRALRPRLVLVENVPGLLVRGIGDVLGDLAACGYDAEWDCIPASAVGAPHRRDRVWIVANAHGDGRPGETLHVPEWGPLQAVPDAAGAGANVAYANDTRLEGRDSGGVPERERAGEFATRASGALADTKRTGLEGGTGGWVPSEWGSPSVFTGLGEGLGGQWLPEPDVGRVAHGVPFELDLARGLANEQGDGAEAESAARLRVGHFLRAVWEHHAIAATSPDLYLERLRDSVPSLPCGGPRSQWLLGPRLEAHEGLRDLWAAFYAQPLEEAHDLQRQLLEQLGKTQRPQALGSRVDRLRGLGNAVVPQVAEWIGRRLLTCL